MGKAYTKDEVLENGYHQISIYDANSQSLLSTYQTTPDGKKDGEEIEYFEGSKDIKRTTNWKDGQKDGLEKIYTNKGEISVEREYNDGIPTKEHFYGLKELASFLAFIGKSVPERELSLYKFLKDIVRSDVVKENGEFKHITLRTEDRTIYDMEFKDSKEYDGYYDFVDRRSSWGGFRDRGKIKNGKLTGGKIVSQRDSLCRKFMESDRDYECWQTFEDDELVSHHAYRYWYNEYDSYEDKIYIPVNGEAHIYMAFRSPLIFDMKDGKINGEYRDHMKNIKATYKDDVLDGPYTEFFDRINGKKKVEGFYKNGKKEGVWKYYGNDGKVINQECWKDGRREYRDYKLGTKTYFKDDVLDGPYTEFFDKIDGKKKVEGFYKEGKKEGVWKYYDKDGTVIRQEYWHKGKNCTKKYEILKKVATKRIEEEERLSQNGERVVLPKMTAQEKRKAIREAKRELSR